MENKDMVYLANFLVSLNETRLLEDKDFFFKIHAVTANFHNEDIAIKAKQDASSFEEAFRKACVVLPESVGEVQDMHKPVRTYVDGVFDLIHSGHFNALRQAKQMTDILVAGVVSDEEVALVKGPPIMNLQERAELVAACKWVDEVQTDNIPYNPSIELIDRIGCQFVAHGDDFAPGADGTDCYTPIKAAGRMKIFKRTEGISTTDIMGRLLELAAIEHGPKQEAPEEIKDDEKPKGKHAAPVKFLQTTRRIRNFSTGRIPTAEDKIVYIDGSFDLIHLGHVRFLKKARALGTYVIVGVHDDDSIAKRKSHHYPVLSLPERTLCVLALKDVDEVVIGAPSEVTQNLINTLGVHVVAEGSVSAGQYNTDEDPYEAAKKLGIYQVVETDTDTTSMKFRKRIIDNKLKYEEIFAKKKKKQDIYYEAEPEKTIKEI